MHVRKRVQYIQNLPLGSIMESLSQTQNHFANPG
jgi:hypothetical protein